MHRFLKPVALMAVGMACGLGVCSQAMAQNTFGQRSRNVGRPTTSPYLNLLNNNNFGGAGSFGLNYYQQVRPQQDFRSAIQQQQRDLNRLQGAPAQTPANAGSMSQSPTSRLSQTGHTTSFLNLGGFFPGGPGGLRR